MSTGVRHPASAMAEARRLHNDAGGAWSLREIADQLHRTHGVRPSTATILRWVDPDWAERHRERRTANNRAWLERTGRWRFTLQGHPSGISDEYRDAFIRRLDAEGIPRRSILKVCRVVLPANAQPTISDINRALDA